MKCTCIDCGKTFEGKTSRAKVCPSCQHERRKQSQRDYVSKRRMQSREDFKRWYNKTRRVPDTVDVQCQGCNCIFEANSRRRKFCDSCIKAKKRERAREWRANNPDKVEAQRRRAQERRQPIL